MDLALAGPICQLISQITNVHYDIDFLVQSFKPKETCSFKQPGPYSITAVGMGVSVNQTKSFQNLIKP
ncbi:hypothetical protein Fmac_021678 [Flemingia macrophylla]|uniref:Uncharacterized protein n=1 Tax=Flemingia macrophylla TaxID=520843 RepID=A0ABD1LXN6_9FABA